MKWNVLICIGLLSWIKIETEPEVRLRLFNKFDILQDSGITSISEGTHNNHYNDPVESTGFKIRVIDF